MGCAAPLFVVFEGLDGSGKSTCARQLSELLGGVFMTTPSQQMRRYRNAVIEDLGPSQEARQLFYLGTVFAAAQEIDAHLAAGRSVVLDRYFLSTQAYASFRGSALTVDALQRHLRPADFTVYLDTSLGARRERLAKRGTSAADLETLSEEADVALRTEHFERAELAINGRFLRVAGDPGPPPEVFARVVRALAGAGALVPA